MQADALWACTSRRTTCRAPVRRARDSCGCIALGGARNFAFVRRRCVRAGGVPLTDVSCGASRRRGPSRPGNSHPSGSPERHGDLPAGRLPRAGAAGAGRVRRRHTPAAAAARAAERHSAQRGAGARGRRLLVWAHPRCVHAPTRLVGPRKSPWGYAQGNAPPVSALRPPSLPCLGPSARRAAAQSTAALGVAA